MVLAFSVVAQGNLPLDPFLPYTDRLTKNQTRDAMKDWNFSCQFVLSEGQQGCSFHPDGDAFSAIYVTIAQGVPQRVSFEVKRDALQLGDLVLLWGKPDTVFPYSAPRLLWSEEDGITRSALVPPADRLNYLAPVKVVSFTF